jgi:hypothetical protein
MTRAAFIVAAIAAMACTGQACAAPAPLVDNEQVTVWDVPLKVGETTPPTPADLDAVVMFLDGGRFKVTDAAGRPVATGGAPGQAVAIPRGTRAVTTLVSGGPAHAVIVALKDFRKPPYANPGSLPLAFPRTGSSKVLETPRVVVWNYSWKLNENTQPHFHDKDVVLAYREEGAIDSITLDGQHTVTPHHPGEIRFNPGDRSHFERLVSGRQSSITLELK